MSVRLKHTSLSVFEFVSSPMGSAGHPLIFNNYSSAFFFKEERKIDASLLLLRRIDLRYRSYFYQDPRYFQYFWQKTRSSERSFSTYSVHNTRQNWARWMKPWCQQPPALQNASVCSLLTRMLNETTSLLLKKFILHLFRIVLCIRGK